MQGAKIKKAILHIILPVQPSLVITSDPGEQATVEELKLDPSFLIYPTQTDILRFAHRPDFIDHVGVAQGLSISIRCVRS